MLGGGVVCVRVVAQLDVDSHGGIDDFWLRGESSSVFFPRRFEIFAASLGTGQAGWSRVSIPILAGTYLWAAGQPQLPATLLQNQKWLDFSPLLA
jgi:hypothetical protein